MGHTTLTLFPMHRVAMCSGKASGTSSVMPYASKSRRISRSVERQLRIDSVYEGDSYRSIELFDPDGQRRSEVKTSLDRVARLIEGDTHGRREALRLLTETGDFTTSRDLTGLPPYRVFAIRRDGEQFDQQRIAIHGATEGSRIRVTLPRGTD
ncbi:hypothetical protein C8250_042195 [Streptomyces sp. So13.3]|uniref:DUF6042 family protein n=1 Tax=Streptomyces TaxID=1883 RepID=UPI00110616CC|nr:MULTISPECIES: DUF6042 family protein [Streptomyces]MCZ4102079.1 DUF6042 family protein [Streptomyces sp. H39-C1]QNA77528.1 hypothetical protein C8250_042195 [Streptomyces sp. So13.3]